MIYYNIIRKLLKKIIKNPIDICRIESLIIDKVRRATLVLTY